MKLTQALQSIKGPAGEKTASVAPSQDGSAEKSATAATSEKLKQALKEATAPVQEKQASAPAAESPIAGLSKIASDIASAEHEALVKEAQLYGASVFDGFIARAQQWEAAGVKVAGMLQSALVPASAPAAEKTASDSFEKFAAENPSIVKEAAELGYQTTLSQMDKLAQAAQQKGYDDAVVAIYKTANDAFVRGFADGAQLLEALGK